MVTDSSVIEESVRYLNRPGGPIAGPYAGVGRHAIVLNPGNLGYVLANLPALLAKRPFDGLVLDGFDKSNPIEASGLSPLVPLIREVTIKDSCKGFNSSPLRALQNLVSISTLLPKPRELRLAMFPKLWRATLGRMDDAGAIAGAPKLETLRLFRGLVLEKCGWNWVAALPSLHDLELGMCEIASLGGVPSAPSVKRLTISRPRGLQSLSGIDAFSSLEELQIESAPQLADLSGLLGLQQLKHVSLIGCQPPESLDLFRGLPNLVQMLVNGKDMLVKLP